MEITMRSFTEDFDKTHMLKPNVNLPKEQTHNQNVRGYDFSYSSSADIFDSNGH